MGPGSVKSDTSREASLKRAEELSQAGRSYLEARRDIPSWLDRPEEEYRARREYVMEVFGAGEEEWQNWKWHVENRITTAAEMNRIFDLAEESKETLEELGTHFRWAVSPYYASLMDYQEPGCPLWRQSVPALEELEDMYGSDDPMAEEFTSPAPAVTRRYPDRLIINVTNACAMFCRHCQRRRNTGTMDTVTPDEDLLEALDYVRATPEIRDVLITGGDPLTLPDERIHWILTQLDEIEHVEIKRIGSRVPVTLPQRITSDLCRMLSQHQPLYLNTQFNHPREVTPDALAACRRLAMAGVSLGNQAVLLRGVNDDPHVMKKLHQDLLRIHVRPYYIFQAKWVRGTSHFIAPVEKGMEIMEQFRGHTSGLAIPTYVINAPRGHGKIPVMPNYLLYFASDHVGMRSWEGRMFRYRNPTRTEDDSLSGGADTE